MVGAYNDLKLSFMGVDEQSRCHEENIYIYIYIYIHIHICVLFGGCMSQKIYHRFHNQINRAFT